MSNRILPHKISARLNFEWKSDVSTCDLRSKLFDPMMIQGEDIIAKPDMVNACLFEHTHLFSHSGSSAQLEVIARDWLRAPVAAKWASSAGNHICGEVAMCIRPRHSVAFKINEIPRRNRKL